METVPLLVAWLVLYRRLRSCDGGTDVRSLWLRDTAEGLSLFLFLYAVLGSLSALAGQFHHLWLAGLLVIAMAAVLLANHPSLVPVRGSGVGTKDAVALALALAIFATLSWTRFDYLRMGADAGVYVNAAKNLYFDGSTVYRPDLLPGDRSDLTDAAGAATGLYCPEPGDCYYQFLPGWPSILAFGMSLFGLHRYSYVMVVVGLLVVYWFYRVLQRWLTGWRLAAGTLCFSASPLLVFFSKYTTSELFLLLAVLFTVEAGLSGDRWLRYASLAAIGAVAVTHISLFLYLPLLGLLALRSTARPEPGGLFYLRAATVLLIVSLPLAYLFSPQYFRDIFGAFGKHFGSVGLPAGIVPGVIGLLALVGAGLPGRGRATMAQRWLARLPWLAPLLLGATLAYSAWHGIALGWGNVAAAVPWKAGYAGRGVLSLAHLSVVSVALALGITFFVVLVGLVLCRPRAVVRDELDLWLVIGALAALAAHVVINPDLRENYYHSRYFLPMVVPFALLYVLRRAAAWRDRYFCLLVLPVLLFDVVFSGFLLSAPPLQAPMRFARQLQADVPAGSTVLALGSARRTDWLVANLVRYDLRSRYLYLGERDGGGGGEALATAAGLRQQGENGLFLLSERRLPLLEGTNPVRRYQLRDRVPLLWEDVMYPFRYTWHVEAYNLYDLGSGPGEHAGDRVITLGELALLSPESFLETPGGWSTGRFHLHLEPAVGEVRRVRLVTGGRLLALIEQDDRIVSEITLVIGEDEYAEELDAEEIVVRLREAVSVDELIIRSGTFVPLQLGINQDPRTLGIDLQSVVLE